MKITEQWKMLRALMEEEYTEYLAAAHSSEEDVFIKNNRRYFFLDGGLIEIPTYLYHIREYWRCKCFGWSD